MLPTVPELAEHFAEECKRDAQITKTILHWILPDFVGNKLDLPIFQKYCSKRLFRPELRKSRLKTGVVWDKDMIIDMYRNYTERLTFMELSQKAVVLILLATAKRPSEVRQMDLDLCDVTPNKYTFFLPNPTKTSR